MLEVRDPGTDRRGLKALDNGSALVFRYPRIPL
jgi:hypothetical protein